jgi:transcriptional regulator with XRE-family HTH domain
MANSTLSGVDGLDRILTAVGPRLRSLRQARQITLADLSVATDISVSTLSRLESGQRRATLELLLPLAKAYQVPLDELVGAPPTGDPRIHQHPITRGGKQFIRLSRQPGGLQAFKVVIPPSRVAKRPEPQTHDGYEWLYVLTGRLRMVLGEHDLVLETGEAAEFDTRLPHWIGNAGSGPVEVLSLFGPQGERMHVRARPTKKTTRAPRQKPVG